MVKVDRICILNGPRIGESKNVGVPNFWRSLAQAARIFQFPFGIPWKETKLHDICPTFRNLNISRSLANGLTQYTTGTQRFEVEQFSHFPAIF